MLKIWHTAVFQGNLHKKHYFEGWYYKIVDPEEKTAYAIIPGISLAPGKKHAFIQFFDARNNRSFYFTFGVNDFKFDTKSFNLYIGKSHFSLSDIRLDIDTGIDKLSADLRLSNVRGWPVKLLSPGAMGWYAFVPFMECYHDILGFDVALSGQVNLNGHVTDFAGGKGYMEKDWGISMPSSWIWMQTNHFNEPDVSFMLSIARIPWLGNHFTGLLAAVYLKKKIYRFTTYTGAKVDSFFIDDKKISVTIVSRNYKVEIEANRVAGADLPAPKLGEMSGKVNEALKSEIRLTFYADKSKPPVFSGKGRNGGLEVVGSAEDLLKGHSV
jgi:tocopherol cyclase